MNRAVADEASWWSQPCGPGEVLAIALPLVASTAAWTVMHFTDRVFLTWHSPVEMAAAMPAGMLLFTLMSFPLGLVSFSTTFVAQYHGAERPARIGAVMGQAVRIATYCVPLFMALIPLVPWLFRAAGHVEPLLAYETLYMQVLLLGAGASILGSALSAFFTGRGETHVVMYVHVAGSALNVVLDYLWIFGHAGFPEGGLEGAAYATVVSDWVKVGLFWWLLATPENEQRYHLEAGRALDWPLLRRMLWFGGPNGLHLLSEAGAFTVFLLLMGRLGEVAMGATTLAFSVNSLTFVPMLGVGMAVGTLVGRELGANRPDMAERATWNALGLAAAYTGVFGALYLAVPEWFLLAHSQAGDAQRFDELRGLAVILLRFVAAYCLLDALNVVFSGALRGAGDTLFVVLATVLLGAVFLALGWWGLEYAQFDLWQCWWVITAWVSAIGLAFGARFLYGAWRTMRVIEDDVLADEPPTPTPTAGELQPALESTSP